MGTAGVDGDLVYQILAALRTALQAENFIATFPSQLALVILRTLVAVLPSLGDDSPFWTALGWLAIAFLQVNAPLLSAAAVPLLTVVVSGIRRTVGDSWRLIADEMLDWREVEGARSILDALEDSSGVNLESHFSFAVAALLVEPFQNRATRNSAISLLEQLVQAEIGTRTDKGLGNNVDESPIRLLLKLALADIQEHTALDGSESGNIALRIPKTDMSSAVLAMSLSLSLYPNVEDTAELCYLLNFIVVLLERFEDVQRML